MCPRYVSKGGVCHPAKEKIALVNESDKEIEVNGVKVPPGDPFIYEGPDRAALIELAKMGQETMGEDFEHSQDYLKMVRELGFKSSNDYLKFIGYDKEKADKEFNDKASVVHKDDLKSKAEAVKMMGGGIDTAGNGEDLPGGFGKLPY